MTQVESDIIRCRRCLTLVYEGAATCHHCGEDLSTPRKRRIFTRKTWLFIFLVLMGWTGIDAAILIHERKNIYRSDASLIDNFVGNLFKNRKGFLEYQWGGRDDEFERIKTLPDTLGFKEVMRLDVGDVTLLRKCEHVIGYFSHDARTYDFTAREWKLYGDRNVLHGRACVSKDFPRQILCLHLQREFFTGADDEWCSARRLIPERRGG